MPRSHISYKVNRKDKRKLELGRLNRTKRIFYFFYISRISNTHLDDNFLAYKINTRAITTTTNRHRKTTVQQESQYLSRVTTGGPIK